MARTILIVDDEVDIIEPMRILLEDDFTVFSATSGADALEILAREPIEMIISDQRMPGMSGVELLTRVKEHYPTVVRILLTGYTDPDAMIQSVNEGRVYRYIVKPWKVAEMKVVIWQGLQYRDLVINEGKLNADLQAAHEALAARTRELEEAQTVITQQEKLAAVGRFAAEMVHEMNNHLHVILGLNSFLSTKLENEVPELKALEGQVKTLAEIAGDIRDFAKGAVSPMRPMMTDPLNVAKEVARACMHHPAFANTELHLATENVTDWMIDPKQIQHLLMSLLKNAANASEPGSSIEIHVLTEGDELLFRVKDQGIGMNDETMARIFEPFYSTWETSSGTGLGLNICKRTVDAHGGQITLDSTPGIGTTVTVRIPRSA